MKTATSFLLLTFAGLLSLTCIDAEPCTEAQFVQFGSIAYNADVSKACTNVLPTSGAVSANAFTGVNLCGDEDCITALKKFTAALPECDVAGYSVKASYERAFSACKTGSVPATMPTATPSTSSTETGSAIATATTNTTNTTSQPSTSGASAAKEADTPAPSKTSSASKAPHATVLVASTLIAAGSWLLTV